MILCCLCASNQVTKMPMKQRLLLVLVLFTAILCCAQVPQFSSSEYDGWIYNNPNIPLEQNTIINNKIALYVVSNGLVLSLTSPAFTCQMGEYIDMEVQWITPQWQNENFLVEWVALTAALLDENGMTVDSVTCIPDPVSRTNHLNMSLTVPRSIQQARLRFVAWKSIVSNCGIIREIKTTCGNRADVNGDGEVSIADINAIINVILGLDETPEMILKADVNGDGAVNIPDVNKVIDVIQS